MSTLTSFSGRESGMGLDLGRAVLRCRLRAAEYKKKAEIALLHSDRRYYADMAQQWFVIAEGYEAHRLKRSPAKATRSPPATHPTKVDGTHIP
jgi:hypothetical protein